MIKRSTVELDCLPVSRLGMADSQELIGQWLDEPRPRHVVTANLDLLALRRRMPAFAAAVEAAHLVTADGAPLVWLSKLLGAPISERVAGSDLTLPLVDEAARRGRSVFLLGGRPGVAERMAQVVLGRHPKLDLRGTAAPLIDLDDEQALERTVATIRAAQPDLLLVALGYPKQEVFIHRYLRDLGCRVAIGIGATFDFLVGDIPRAPHALRSAGLEWAFRLSREPRRLAPRYARDLTELVRLIGRAVLNPETHRARQGSPAPAPVRIPAQNDFPGDHP